MATHEIPKLAADQREHLGSRYAARLRKTERLPAVIYGHQQEPAHISIDAETLTDLIRHHSQVVEVSHDSTTESCLIKQVQWDHLGSKIIHVDLTRVDLSELVTTQVELELVGEPVGLKEDGAFLDQSNTTIEVECQAMNIPDNITVEISHLEAGKSLMAGDLTMPEGVTCASPADTVIVAVTVQILTEEEEEGEVTEAATEGEPEVIGAKKEDEQESENES